jgi:hypothetical protein
MPLRVSPALDQGPWIKAPWIKAPWIKACWIKACWIKACWIKAAPNQARDRVKSVMFHNRAASPMLCASRA